VFSFPHFHSSSIPQLFSTHNSLYFQDRQVLRNLPFLDHPLVGIVFLPDDEVNTGVGPSGKEGIIDKSLIYNQN